MNRPRILSDPRAVLKRLEGRDLDVEGIVYGGRIAVAISLELDLEEIAHFLFALRETKGRVYNAAIAIADVDGRPILALLDLLPLSGAILAHIGSESGLSEDAIETASLVSVAATRILLEHEVDLAREWARFADGKTVREGRIAAPAWIVPYLDFAFQIDLMGRMIGEPIMSLYLAGKDPEAALAMLEASISAGTLSQIRGDAGLDA